MKRLSLCAIILSLMLSCCSRDRISTKTAAKIYLETLLLTSRPCIDSRSIRLGREKIFKNYGTDSLAYKKTIEDLMNNDGAEWKKFFSEAHSHLEDLKKSGAIK